MPLGFALVACSVDGEQRDWHGLRAAGAGAAGGTVDRTWIDIFELPEDIMSFAILGMGTAVPRLSFSQRDAAQIDQYMGYETAAQRRFMHEIYAHSGVESRHSVVLEASDGPLELRQSFFPPVRNLDDRGPTTAERVALYTANRSAARRRCRARGAVRGRVEPGDHAW